jgi:hypothetical protein
MEGKSRRGKALRPRISRGSVGCISFPPGNRRILKEIAKQKKLLSAWVVVARRQTPD